MSKLTEILKLFCYDPETDGNLTFNVTEALTKNWEKIDQLVLLAVAAAAAYDPEGSYAVGDYCTHGGKLHKCNTAIPSGEAWNAAHWTETTVAAELAEVRTSLSNKVSGSYQIYNNIAQVVAAPGDTSIQDIIDAMGVHAELHALINTGIANICPSRTGSLHIVRTNQSRANILFFDNAGQLWRGETNNMAEFIGWIKMVDATPPQQYDLPFADGFSNAYDAYPSMYSKTQEGLVTVIMNLKADTLSTGAVVATLPSGFRPAHNISVVAKFGTYKMGAVNIYTNGNISINGPFQTGETTFSFIGSFIATQ